MVIAIYQMSIRYLLSCGQIEFSIASLLWKCCCVPYLPNYVLDSIIDGIWTRDLDLWLVTNFQLFIYLNLKLHRFAGFTTLNISLLVKSVWLMLIQQSDKLEFLLYDLWIINFLTPDLAGVLPGKAAVMQICGDTSHCYVMHIIHSGIPPSLRSLLEDSSVLKVCNISYLKFCIYRISCIVYLVYTFNVKLGIYRLELELSMMLLKFLTIMMYLLKV